MKTFSVTEPIAHNEITLLYNMKKSPEDRLQHIKCRTNR